APGPGGGEAGGCPGRGQEGPDRARIVDGVAGARINVNIVMQISVEREPHGPAAEQPPRSPPRHVVTAAADHRGDGATAAGRPRNADRPDRQRDRAATGRTAGRGGAWDDTTAMPDIQTRPAVVPRRRETTERPRRGRTDEPGRLAEPTATRPARGRGDDATRATSAER